MLELPMKLVLHTYQGKTKLFLYVHIVLPVRCFLLINYGFSKFGTYCGNNIQLVQSQIKLDSIRTVPLCGN